MCMSCGEEEPNLLPVAGFSVKPVDDSKEEIFAGDEVRFIDTSIDEDGQVSQWFWDFGDGNTANIQHPNHVYEVSGTYSIRLLVVDNAEGASEPIFQKISVSTENPLVKVMSYNIQAGKNNNDESNLEGIANLILQFEPGFVCLQEVDVNTNRGGNINMAEVIAEKTGMNYVFGKARNYDGGQFGNAILYKSELLNSENIVLPKGNEDRSAILMTTRLADQATINVVSTHLDAKNTDKRIEEAQVLNQSFATAEYPTILAGDMNDVIGTSTISTLEMIWTLSDADNQLPTWPANEPLKKIDFIMFTPGDQWKVVDANVLSTSDLSDHRPLLVTLELLNQN